MRVIDFKKMLTGFTPGGNNFEIEFVYEALENEDATYRMCRFDGISVNPSTKKVILNFKEEVENEDE